MRQNQEHQEHAVSLATRCDEIIGLIDAVLDAPAVGETTPNTTQAGFFGSRDPASAVVPVSDGGWSWWCGASA